ncbi:nuclear factor related to kappa-B-binding protein [Anopheles maculipalpis]|uniref:nuclear factor related to kappa-B-binding protein n=1 Tax=Anopheles maculipalpis TaxID=1496333 RepID=UPI00215981CF|nr:nuclear factor related to kappa-B-binding protein [Anopheles maculipalpis]
MGRNFELARRAAKSFDATGNAYASSSDSDSDESNASLLERSCMLSNKFMLPKDLCDSGAIFEEFFSFELWDTLPRTTQQKLAKLLPVVKDDRVEATTLVHSLLSHELHRFGKEPMDDFRSKLSNGCFRFDVAKLQHNLAKLTTKDKRMIELQRMSRLAQNVMLSREAVLFSELHSNDERALPTAGRITYNYGRRRQLDYDGNISSSMVKSLVMSKKRYLAEIISICDEVGLSLTLSDEEDCMHALPTGAVRKQRRMVSTGSQSGEQASVQTAAVSSCSNIPMKKPGMIGSGVNGAAGNTIDGTIFNAPKLYVVTEEHYRKLIQQHRKRKMEEPEHPELDLDNMKLKDVVSRTQIAAGYRRILPLPKVYISDSAKEHSAGMKGRVKSQKSFKTHRSSQDQTDSKPSILEAICGEESMDNATVKTEPTGGLNVVLKEENPSNEYFDSNLNDNVEEKCDVLSAKESKRSSNTIEEVAGASETYLTTTVGTSQALQTLSNASLLDAASLMENDDSSTVEQNSMNCLFSNGLHACFLSVVRDLFCSNPDHRSTLPELQLKLEAWTKSSVAERNVWYEQYQNNGEWNETLQSAVQFLAGEFPNQPEDFVPYIEHKVAINILQWIGASRDADSRLVPLCAYWQSRKQEMNKLTGMNSITANNSSCANNVTLNDCGALATASPKSRSRSTAGSKHLPFSPSYSSSSSMSSVSSLPVAGDNLLSLMNDSPTSILTAKTVTASEEDGSIQERSATTPPPLFPTDWSVRKATDEEIQSFREQEKRRYENPHMAFTYKQHSYDSVVGPVKGIYTQAPGISKARGHNMLVANRPNFVTILTLVRDATARLPNGEGTRADICELLKSSQYISPTATDQILQTIVSGALDRMHTERDPCVKYDAKRKIWIYLHRNRTEQEFERLHMQYQGFTKHKKSTVRKSLRQSKENLSSSNSAKQHDMLNESGSTADSFASNNIACEMDLDASATIYSSIMDPVVNTATSISSAENPTANIATVTGVKATTSLLKKQTTLSAPENISVLQSCNDAKNDNSFITTTTTGITTDDANVGLADQSKMCIVKEHQTPVSRDCGTDVTFKASSKLCNAVTLISSSGSNVRTIQIPKSSLTLANTSATSNTGIECSTVDEALSQDSLLNVNPISPKKLLVSAIVSSPKATISPSSGAPNVKQPVVDITRLSNTKPIIVQSVGTAVSSHTPPAGSFVSSPKDGIKIGSTVGGTIVSIRQVNNSSICNVAPKSQILACGQSASILSPQLAAQPKATQLALNNASFASSAGASTIQTMKGGSTLITATIGKPIYSTSIGPSALKQSTNTSSIIQTNLPATVFSQKMMVSAGKANASSASEGSTVPTVVAIKSASTSTITTPGTPIATNRIVKPASNLFSTITLAKGQQSVLTPAKQRQIIQNLLSQNQKNSLANNQIVSPTAVVAANATNLAKGQASDTKQYKAPGASYVLENQTTVPTFKINQNANSNIKTLSSKIVKITPTRSKPTQSAIRSAVTVSPQSVMNPAAAATSVKMIKMNPSTTILTTSEGHGTLNPGTAVAVTVSNNPGTVTPSAVKNATMRVVKTASGATTVIKTEVARGSSAQQIAQINSNLSSGQINSKMLVNSNISAGQLIPLESLLQKPSITGTTNNAGGGVNTILKLAGTTKAGQQFLQFGTGSNTVSSVTGKSITGGSSSAVVSVGHQYTVLPQTRNIISVASTASGIRPTNLPVTIVSSSKSGECFQPGGGSIIVTSRKGNLSEINPTTAGSATSFLSHIASSPTAKLVQQGTKVKLLTTTTHNPNAFGTGPAASVSQQQSTVFSPKTSLPSTVNVSGEFLNAKIIGVHNIGSAKVKGASSLSLMNANSLNIAHIGGKPVLIANNASIGANQAITVSTAHLSSNSGASKSTPSSSMVFTANSNNNSHVLGQPNAANVQTVSTATTGREISRTNVVGGIPGQIQTVLLRNNVLKVQTVPSTSASKLAHQPSIASVSVGSSGIASGINAAAAGTTLIATTGGRCTTVQSKTALQQQPKVQKQPQTISSGGTGVILTPNIPTSSITIEGTVVETNAEIANNSDTVSQRTQSPRVVLSQPIIIPSDVQKSATSINLKRLKVIPISKPSNT